MEPPSSFLVTVFAPPNEKREVVHLYGPFTSRQEAEAERENMKKLYADDTRRAHLKIYIRTPIRSL